jgi:uncharacterized protein
VTIAKSHNIPTRDLHQMRPWFASILLTQVQMASIGYDPALGVDRTLQNESIAAGKTIKPLESASEQLGYLADMPDKIAGEMFVQTLQEVGDGEKVIEAMQIAWLSGNVKQLQKIGPDLMRQGAPELFDAIIKRRNDNWVKQIEILLQGSGTQFIAVGAAHLVGKDSVPDQLAKRGYKVARY